MIKSLDFYQQFLGVIFLDNSTEILKMYAPVLHSCLNPEGFLLSLLTSPHCEPIHLATEAISPINLGQPLALLKIPSPSRSLSLLGSGRPALVLTCRNTDSVRVVTPHSRSWQGFSPMQSHICVPQSNATHCVLCSPCSGLSTTPLTLSNPHPNRPHQASSQLQVLLQMCRGEKILIGLLQAGKMTNKIHCHYMSFSHLSGLHLLTSVCFSCVFLRGHITYIACYLFVPILFI